MIGVGRVLSAVLVVAGPALIPGVSACAEPSGSRQAAPAVPVSGDLQGRLAQMEKELTKQAAERHVAGCSLAVVKDGKTVYLEGIGVKDVQKKQSVTPDTLFAIGSSSKAFTALTVMMSVDEGKLSLSDRPVTYLPYFKLQDSEADSNITINDLMCHRSGLPRTDFAWYTGKLSSEETIRVAGLAKPTAKLGEAFQYQNVMFLTAGQIVSEVQQKPWSEFVRERIFRPLEMKRTETSAAAMQRDPDHSLGYRWDAEKKEFARLPMRNIDAIAPAGAINSSAREMSHWVKFMLDGGVYNGKRLVSEKSYAEIVTKHMSAGGTIGYGYGWFLRDWRGHAVIEHGGNIDGFSAEVAFMPDQHLGFVLLTNANATPFAPASLETVFDSLLGVPKTADASIKPPLAINPEAEVGTYRLEAANLEITVAFSDTEHTLTLTVPGQPTYKLESEGGRKYKLAGMPGFDVLFRQSSTDASITEMAMTQPQGNFVAARGGKANASQPEVYDGPLKELIGTYENKKPHAEFAIEAKSGKVCFSVPGQPPYPLKDTPGSKDKYRLGDLPDAYSLTIHRDSANRVTGVELKQPQGNLDLKREIDQTPAISAEELMAKAIDAVGGEQNLRRHHSLKLTIHSNMVNEGVQAETVEYATALGTGGKTSTFYALGKKIARSRDYFDGITGATESTMAPTRIYGAKELAAARVEADMLDPADWKQIYSTVVVKRMMTVGSEQAYVVVKTPISKELQPITDYISARSFLLIKREHNAITEIGPIPETETFEDYRDFGGVKVACKHTVEIMGSSTLDTTKRVEFDVTIPAATFKPTPRSLRL